MFEQHAGGQKDTRVTSQRRSGVLGLVRKAKSDDEIQRVAPPPTNMATSRAGVRALGRANLCEGGHVQRWDTGAWILTG